MEPLQLTQQYTQTHYQRGVVFSKMGNHNQAIACYTKAIELDPKFPLAYYDRGLLYQKQEKYQQALNDLERYLELVSEEGNLNIEEIDENIKTLRKQLGLS